MTGSRGGPARRDLRQLTAELEGVESQATKLRWAEERPWRRETHLWLEGELPVVDLHDLDVRLAKEVVSGIALKNLRSGAVCFVTGRGRHSISGRSALRDAVGSALGKRARAEGWQLRPAGSGRFVLITDETQAPAVATGRLGWGFWMGVAAFLALAGWLCLGAPGTG